MTSGTPLASVTTCREEPLVALEVHRLGAAGEVEAEAGEEELIRECEVVCTQQFLEEAPDDDLVLFC